MCCAKLPTSFGGKGPPMWVAQPSSDGLLVEVLLVFLSRKENAKIYVHSHRFHLISLDVIDVTDATMPLARKLVAPP